MNTNLRDFLEAHEGDYICINDMYFELVEKLFNAWISNGNIDDSYADIDNIVDWLMDTDLWTEEDRSLMEGLPKEAIGSLACDISDMVEEYILNEV